jgi:aspartyl-tRNA(Asn)/glutamyl-tRNA(Gln) amidotransferase subunit C
MLERDTVVLNLFQQDDLDILALKRKINPSKCNICGNAGGIFKRNGIGMTHPANTSSSEQVSLEQVLRIAELAQLELTPAEQQSLLHDLNSILGRVAQLNELDTASVPAMSQVNDLLHEGTGAADSTLRADKQRPSLDRAKVMGQAPETDGTYFKVPKVIER